MLVGLTPFMEQQAIWEQISNPSIDGGNWNAMGPTPNKIDYRPWTINIPTLRCPSDPGNGLPSLGRTNYGACLGDSSWLTAQQTHKDVSLEDNDASFASTYAQEAQASMRGFFRMYQASKFRDVLDGLSNTIAAGEMITYLGDSDVRGIVSRSGGGFDGHQEEIRDNPIICRPDIDAQRPSFWGSTADIDSDTPDFRRGYMWANAASVFCGTMTILPPNSEICGHDNSRRTTSTAPMSSQHQGGCHILMGDGAVKFITDSIEAGNSSAGNVWLGGVGVSAVGQKSPYGLWGALGTRAAKEVIEEEL